MRRLALADGYQPPLSPAPHPPPHTHPTAGHDLCTLSQDTGSLWVLERGSMLAMRNKERVEAPPEGPCLLGEGAMLAGVVDGCE